MADLGEIDVGFFWLDESGHRRRKHAAVPRNRRIRDEKNVHVRVEMMIKQHF